MTEAPPPGSSHSPEVINRPAALAWCLHDLANTVFSSVVVTVFLPLYVRNVAGYTWPAGVVGTLSMVLAAFVVPILGGAVDRTGRARRWLVRSYFSYSALAVGMSVLAVMGSGVWFVLLLFFASNFLYQNSLVLYNSLLVVVAPPERRGLVSGIGVGLGYIGLPIALGLAYLTVRSAGIEWTFALAGVLVVLFSIPLQIWVPERAVAHPRALDRAGVREELSRVVALVRSLPSTPSIAWFLAGNFLCVDVLNTAIFWVSVFLVHGLGMSQERMLLTLVVASLTAFGFGCAWGWVTDRIGSKPSLMLSAVFMATSFLVLGFSMENPGVVQLLVWTTGTAGMSGIWVAGRKLLVDLVPESRAGAYFGLYGLTNKGAAFGVALFALITDTLGYRAALFIGAIPLAGGILCLSRVRTGARYDGTLAETPSPDDNDREHA